MTTVTFPVISVVWQELSEQDVNVTTAVVSLVICDADSGVTCAVGTGDDGTDGVECPVDDETDTVAEDPA